MANKALMALLMVGVFLIYSPTIVLASSTKPDTIITEPGAPTLEGDFIGTLPTMVSNSVPADMALISVSGIPQSLMVEVKSGETTVAVLKGNNILYVKPFWVDTSEAVELRLSGTGMPVNSRLVFEPVINELWGQLNINILPPNSELTGPFGINILPSQETGLAGQFSINILN